jgi:2-methylisocitrate lyase-like PEP mutase family enzyme
MPTLHEKASAFMERHRRPGIVVLPNAWDPGTAITLADAGFRSSPRRAPGSRSPRA